ncbi:MAG: NAD-dependent deacylase [Anaerolineales bacterium]|jgi:NAD-dependent deacetylase
MRIAALTGAGISAESGVPTFRGAAGLWHDHRPEDLATPTAFRRDPQLVWEFYAWRRELVSKCKPNQAHLILAEMQFHNIESYIITQNVDGLHQKAGSTDVIELHGSLWKLKCTHCDHHWGAVDVPLPELPPSCPICRKLARPDVVWFGETLDAGVLNRSLKVVSEVDLILVIGTSALVNPAAHLPRIGKENGATIIEINPEGTPVSGIADEVYREPATSGLMKWWQQFLKNN